MDTNREKRKARKRRRRQRRIQAICKWIILICFVIILVSLCSILISKIWKPEPKNPELMSQIQELQQVFQSAETMEESTCDSSESCFEGSVADSEESKEQQTESPDSTSEEEDLRTILNRATLNPVYPQEEKLKTLLDEIMPQIIGDCEDVYEQVEACYSYLIRFCSYSTTTKYTYEEDAFILLTTRRGSCTYYSAAFHYMMKYIGLEDQIIDGYRYLDGEESFHRWNEITVGEQTFLFDTQWDDVLSQNGTKPFTRFGKRKEEVKEFYVL